MEIKVFGPGCAKCAQTEQLVRDVVAAKGVAASVLKVSDIKEMMMAGILSTPAVTVDGVIKSTGKVPSKDEIGAWLDGASGTLSISADADAPAKAGCCQRCGKN